jgi:hypothetical protein
MTTFPSLIPSTRTFTPGIYPHTAFVGMSGRSNRVRNSNVMLESQLRLTFAAISESQMLSILAHYNGRQGRFQSFPLPSEIWSGGVPSDYQLAGYGWVYKEPPTVEDLMCGGHNVELLLETVPPEGTALLGLSLTVRYLLAAGMAVTAPGAALSMTYALADGLIGAPGINGTIDYSLTPGAVESGFTDPNFASVSLLLHMDSTFADSGPGSLTVTANGNAQVSTSRPLRGAGSGLFDGNNDYLTVSDASLAMGTGDFTIEMMVRRAGDGAAGSTVSQTLIDFRTAEPSAQIYLYIDNESSGRQFRYYVNGSARISGGSGTLDTTRHVALVRSSGTTKLYIDGIQVGGDYSDSSNYTGTTLTIAGRFAAVSGGDYRGFNGRLDELRITKVARYASNFTPPTAPFPDS